MAKQNPVDSRELKAVILRRVDGMRRDKKHCDFLIKVGSEEIPVHRNILCATSDYFDTMFSHPTRENESGVVEMIGVDPECSMICVDHMYGKEVSILPDKYEPLMYAANLMQLHTLHDAIVALLEANLNPKSFFIAKRIANMYGCKKLEEVCNDFSEENFGLISKEEEFVELDKSYIKKMVKSKHVKTSEEVKLDAILNWLKHDSSRSKHLNKLMDPIVPSEISAGYRRYVAENEPLISENFQMYKRLTASLLDSMNVVPKRASIQSQDEHSALVVFDKFSGHLQSFSPNDNSWKQMQKFNNKMEKGRFSAVFLGDHIYVLNEKSIYQLKHFDENGKWEKMPDMNERHGTCPPATVCQGSIYVIGGHEHWESASVEKYDTVLKKWTELQNKPRPSQYAELMSCETYISSFGGRYDGTFSKEVERFDSESFTWSTLPPMNEAKGFVAVVGLFRLIYVLGGYQGLIHLSTVERYDPVVNR